MQEENLTFEGLPKAFLRLEQRCERMEQMLLHLVPQSAPELPITITQAAEHINLAVPTLYSLVSRGEIPVNKKGKRLYFLKSELTDWIRSGRRKTIAESQSDPQNHIRISKGKGGLK